MDEKRRRLLRRYRWACIALSGALAAMGAITETWVETGIRAADVPWQTFFIGFAAVAYALPGLLVTLAFRVYWSWRAFKPRDNWLLGFAVAAVQAPMICVMISWLIYALANAASGEAMYGIWIIPLALLPATAPLGLLLGFAAFILTARHHAAFKGARSQ